MSLKRMKNQKIIQAFNQFKKDSRLHPELFRTGCEERTKIICQILTDQGEEAGFLVVPKENGGYCDEKLSCSVQLQNGGLHNFKWTNHFVPFVINEQGKIIVLDICLMDGPELLENWCQHIKYNGKKLNPRDCLLNHPKNISGLDLILRGQDPYARLETFANPNAWDNIVPHQRHSKWLAQQNSLLKNHLMLQK